VPHVAFATGALLLFAEGGWLYRVCSVCSPPADRYGIGLGLTMAIKESGFLLWVIYGLLSEKRLAEQATVLKSQGYGRWQCLNWLILPTLLPSLAIVLVATTAWSLSTVDVALVIGPGNPPTLAVLAWQWLNQGDDMQQAKGALASLLLLLILGGLLVCAWGGWRLWQRRIPDLRGIRRPQPRALAGRLLAIGLPLSGLLCALLLAALAQSASALSDSLANSLGLALLASWRGRLSACCGWSAALPAAIAGSGCRWFCRRCRWPTASINWRCIPGWMGNLPPSCGAICCGWCRGCCLFCARRGVTAIRGWNWSREPSAGDAGNFWRVKLPMLTRPLLMALAVGFSVSIAQYLPTLWLGAGRTPTLTSEAVALSSGGDTQRSPRRRYGNCCCRRWSFP
jgi:putative thiamine transport system permease protein